MTSITVVLDKEGNARHLLDEAHDELYAVFGPVQDIYRNSHVERPEDLSDRAIQALGIDRDALPPAWFADMTPCCSATVLGPYDTRRAALAAEIAWLLERHLPVPNTHT